MTVTSKEIADICGVSRGTVDRALNNRPGINEKTKQHIMKIAEELGYRPHFFAQSLVKGKSMSIGVIVFDIRNHYFANLVSSIELRAKEKGYFVYLTLTNNEKETEIQCIEHLVNRKVDGIILFSVNKGEEFKKYLMNLPTKVITIGNKICDELPFIGIDDRQALRDVVHFVEDKGYSNIIYVSPPLAKRNQQNMYALEERLKGLLEACHTSLKLNEVTVLDNKHYLERLEKLKSNFPPRTVIICSSDIYVLEVLNHLKAWGIRVPEDVGLMGFDNISILKYVTPSLSTVSYPVEQMGINAVDFLVDDSGSNPASLSGFLQHVIIEGQST